VPVPVFVPVLMFLPAPVERTALDVAVPAPFAAEAAPVPVAVPEEAAPVPPLAPALVPVLVPVSTLLESLEEVPYCLPDEATDVPEEGSLVVAAPASVPMFLPAPVPAGPRSCSSS